MNQRTSRGLIRESAVVGTLSALMAATWLSLAIVPRPDGRVDQFYVFGLAFFVNCCFYAVLTPLWCRPLAKVGGVLLNGRFLGFLLGAVVSMLGISYALAMSLAKIASDPCSRDRICLEQLSFFPLLQVSLIIALIQAICFWLFSRHRT